MFLFENPKKCLLFFLMADTMSLISSPLEAAMANYNHAALNISFDLLKNGASKLLASRADRSNPLLGHKLLEKTGFLGKLQRKTVNFE